MIVLALACAGALGAPARFLVEQALTQRLGHEFPWGTASVNLVGAFALGLLVGVGEFHGMQHDVTTVVGTGFLGAFTTFSAFAVESTRLDPRRRAQYVALSVLGGLGLVAGGLALASV